MEMAYGTKKVTTTLRKKSEKIIGRQIFKTENFQLKKKSGSDSNPCRSRHSRNLYAKFAGEAKNLNWL